MLRIKRLHHAAIICRDYEKSKRFYTDVLGFEIIRETYREDRLSYKLDLSMNGGYLLELFSFPDPSVRVTRPEASGLRHIAFEEEDVEESIQILSKQGILTEPIRIDKITNKPFTLINDPDHLPIELYER
jgi:glyoxylase I family protein